jgi:NAD(P)-dependent dehydrogenase (short-subunit alcohol dehydrogenase family)
MNGWLEGKVALITGGAGGIGRSIVERFLAEGARVGVMDLSREGLRALGSDPQLADGIVTSVGDVRVLGDNEDAVLKTVRAFGRLDVFVGNAAVFDCLLGLERLPVDLLDDAFREVFETNVKGYLLGARAALPELRKASGNMIFTVSSSGFYPNGGGPLYTASKHAVVGLIRQLAYELAPDIRVNGVAPGGTAAATIGAAPSLKPVCPQVEPEVRNGRIGSGNRLGLAPLPQDHVSAYVLLASDGARAMTGSVIHSDGGIAVR